VAAAAASRLVRDEPPAVGLRPAEFPRPAGRSSRPGDLWDRLTLQGASTNDWGHIMESKAILATAVAILCVTGAATASADDLTYEWYPVATNGDLVPGTSKLFNSYNQPAVNDDGRVVFRARSRGGQGQGAGQPEHGIFMRDLEEFGLIVTVFTRGGTVPQPNNATYGPNKDLARFNEFPSVPRIDAGSGTIATRGMSQPVWQNEVDDTRTGSAGVYTNPSGAPTTAAAMLGDVPGFEYFQVPIPEIAQGTGFDQFPGSPAVTEGNTIVFKGNFTVGGVGKTGVFYRNAVASSGVSPIELIASSYTDIPGCTDTQTSEVTCKKFGSTAPPSAAGKYVVFAGYDNEATPTAGGIYRARLGNKPIKLETIVQIGDPVPGETGETFKTFGEAVSLSSNGRHILFWGTWGSETYDVEVICPSEGNEASVKYKYCLSVTPTGTAKPVPVHQGFFVRDMQLGKTVVIAKTGGDFKDFVYWNFSGRVPGMGGGGEGGDDIEEPARWRTATFGAVSAHGVPSVSAFKAKTSDGTPTGTIDGIYLRKVLPPPSKIGDVTPLLKVGMPGVDVDPRTPSGALISALGIERDGFRGEWLALTVSMLAEGGTEEDTGWAGIYAARFMVED